ncbi:DUF397 domain-containing protein [Micromonospora sp. KC723]|uniref:DUF397 domain-containing protein n=1 Tax=Micromonospora sp. KC723 TaxID=2530381 RepID=UPI001048CE98|nr:DUF397 domain-containing protein [Micromonospora sp. KC723]TDB74518.1 DUF397 domain-containing protein [Micromonospora sp. KC723]
MTTLTWKKSTRSNWGGNCLEVAVPPEVVMVRTGCSSTPEPFRVTCHCGGTPLAWHSSRLTSADTFARVGLG